MDKTDNATLVKTLRDNASSLCDKQANLLSVAADRIEYLAQFVEWIPASERLPDPGMTVLAFFRNELGNSRIVRAARVEQFQWEADEDIWDTDYCEYDENTGTSYLPAGWYEHTDGGETAYQISNVTHWLPLPPKPEVEE